MPVRMLDDAMKIVSSWPDAAQEELAAIAFDMDAALKGGAYHATADELAGIDRGLRAADEGRVLESGAAEAIFARHRRS